MMKRQDSHLSNSACERLICDFGKGFGAWLEGFVKSKTMAALGMERRFGDVRRDACNQGPIDVKELLSGRSSIMALVTDWIEAMVDPGIDPKIEGELTRVDRAEVKGSMAVVEHAAFRFNDVRVRSREQSYIELARDLGHQHAQEDAAAIEMTILLLREKSEKSLIK